MSVIIFAFNNERHITEAVESVLAQQFNAGWEVIIAEDCSSDSTRDVIKAYKRRYPDLIRLALARRNTKGAEIWREAVRAACGEYVALLDGDDFLIFRTNCRTGAPLSGRKYHVSNVLS